MHCAVDGKDKRHREGREKKGGQSGAVGGGKDKKGTPPPSVSLCVVPALHGVCCLLFLFCPARSLASRSVCVWFISRPHPVVASDSFPLRTASELYLPPEAKERRRDGRSAGETDTGLVGRRSAFTVRCGAVRCGAVCILALMQMRMRMRVVGRSASRSGDEGPGEAGQEGGDAGAVGKGRCR